MAMVDGTESFKSGLELEEQFIEFKALVQSYDDVAGEETPPLIFTLERALDRLEAALTGHLSILHRGAK